MKGHNPSANAIRISPPISSHFQAITRKKMRIKAGILWIRNARICCQMVNRESKESRENMPTNRIARIQMMRGTQWMILMIVFMDGFFSKLV